MFEYLYFQDRRPKLLAALLLVLVMACTGTPAIAVEPEQPSNLWAALKTGTAFAIMRHALAPGVGDPANLNSPIVAPSETRRATDADRPSKSANGLKKRYCKRRGIHQRGVAAATRQSLKLGKVVPWRNRFVLRNRNRQRRKPMRRSWLSAYRSNAPLIPSLTMSISPP